MKKKKVGEIASDLLLKTPETRDPIEIQREVQKDYIQNLYWAVQHAQKKVDCSHLAGTGRGHDNCASREAVVGDFYVVVVTKREKLMENVLRNYFFHALVCPTPDYDQTVYKYDAKKETLTYLWTVPDIETCETFKRDASSVVPEEQKLLEFVLKFYDGTLLRQARQLNGENLETGIVLEGK